jgi:hypothetical protein
MAKLTLDESLKVDAGHVGVIVEAEALEIETDELALLEGTADASSRAIAADIRAITAPVAESTRRRADHPGTRLFNNTGALANGIEAVESGGAIEVRAPADRLEDDAVASRLVELVDSIRDPLAAPAVDRALEQAVDDIAKKR